MFMALDCAYGARILWRVSREWMVQVQCFPAALCPHECHRYPLGCVCGPNPTSVPGILRYYITLHSMRYYGTVNFHFQAEKYVENHLNSSMF